MLSPKKVKWRRQHRNFNSQTNGKTDKGSSLNFGDYGLYVIQGGKITARQLEASRIAINRSVKRSGKLWIRIFPDKPITKKPAEVRMGKGKGPPEYWVALVKPGRILFEMSGVSQIQAKEAFRLASHKLPLRTKFLFRL